MNKALILANLHLHAVLPRLEELVKLDSEAKAIAQKLNLSIKFLVRGGPSVVLTFKDGNVTANTDGEGKADIGLLFLSCDQLNALFTGGKAIPIPYKGIIKIGAMKHFGKLTEMLTKYLKPSDEDMKDAAFRAKHVEMSLMTGLSGAITIAKYDTKMQKVVNHLPDGTILFSVLPDGPYANVSVERKNIIVKNGFIENSTTTLEMNGVDLAADMFADKLDTFAALGAGEIRASGLLTLGDEFNALVDRVSYYLV